MGDRCSGCSEFCFQSRTEGGKRRFTEQIRVLKQTHRKAIKSQLKRYQWCSPLKQKPASCLAAATFFFPLAAVVAPFHSAFARQRVRSMNVTLRLSDRNSTTSPLWMNERGSHACSVKPTARDAVRIVVEKHVKLPPYTHFFFFTCMKNTLHLYSQHSHACTEYFSYWK